MIDLDARTKKKLDWMERAQYQSAKSALDRAEKGLAELHVDLVRYKSRKGFDHMIEHSERNLVQARETFSCLIREMEKKYSTASRS
jgi:hypothetical protein